MKGYLLVFDRNDADKDIVIRIIDRMPEIQNWHAFFGNTMCLATEIGAKELAHKINAALPDLTYIVTEVMPDQKGGRIPKSVLAFLNSPAPVHADSA